MPVATHGCITGYMGAMRLRGAPRPGKQAGLEPTGRGPALGSSVRPKSYC